MDNIKINFSTSNFVLGSIDKADFVWFKCHEGTPNIMPLNSTPLRNVSEALKKIFKLKPDLLCAVCGEPLNASGSKSIYDACGAIPMHKKCVTGTKLNNGVFHNSKEIILAIIDTRNKKKESGAKNKRGISWARKLKRALKK